MTMTEERKKPEPTAFHTERPNNKFVEKVYVRVFQDGTMKPVDRRQRRSATHVVKLEIEYISYEEELEIKRGAVRFDERNNVHYTDYDYVSEERIRRCLAGWNLHELFPGVFPKLYRVRRVLEDDSMEAWKRLPPLLRKGISMTINGALGPA